MATNLFVSFHSLKNVYSAFLRSCSCQCCSFTHLVYAPCVPATRGMCKSVFQLFLVYASKLERHRLGKLIRSSALPVSSKTPASCWFTQENVSLRLHQVLIRRVYVPKFPVFFFFINIYIIVHPTGCASFFKPFLVYIEVRFQMGEMDHSFENQCTVKEGGWERPVCPDWKSKISRNYTSTYIYVDTKDKKLYSLLLFFCISLTCLGLLSCKIFLAIYLILIKLAFILRMS